MGKPTGFLEYDRVNGKAAAPLEDVYKRQMQGFIGKPAEVKKGLDFDRRLYVARRVFEQSNDDTYVVSMSSRTIVYLSLIHIYINTSTVKTNVDSLIGKDARVTAEVNNAKETGTVSVQGQEWTARSEKEDAVYPEGTRVWIREIQGVKLIVSDEKAVGLSQEKEEV